MADTRKGKSMMWLSLILAAGFLFGIPPVNGQGIHEDAWRSFRGHQDNSGAVTCGFLTVEGEELRLEWEYPADDEITSSISVSKEGLFFGTLNGTLFCLDPSDGGLSWKYETGAGIASTPAISPEGDTVVCCNDKGDVVALSTADGALFWNWSTSGGGAIKSSPMICSGSVFFGSYDSCFYCLDLQNGSTVWTYTSCGGWIHTSPSFQEESVLFGACDGSLNRVDSISGDPIWTFMDSYIPSSPAVSDGRVYFGSYDRSLYCLDFDTGEVVWNRTLGEGIYSSPSVFGGMVAVGCDDGDLYLIDALSGDVVWNRSLHRRSLEASPILAADCVLVTNDQGLELCHLENGSVFCSFETGDCGDTSPAVYDGTVFWGDKLGYVHAVGIIKEDENGEDQGDGGEDHSLLIFLAVKSAILSAIMLFVLLAYLRIRKRSR